MVVVVAADVVVAAAAFVGCFCCCCSKRAPVIPDRFITEYDLKNELKCWCADSAKTPVVG